MNDWPFEEYLILTVLKHNCIIYKLILIYTKSNAVQFDNNFTQEYYGTKCG